MRTKFISAMMMEIIFVTLLVGCAQHNAEDTSLDLPALPSSWTSGSDKEETPTLTTDMAVADVFKVHTETLEDLNLISPSANSISSTQDHPLNWTPWHLDGMIANFGIDVGGIFGAFLLDGTASITGTWKQRKALPSAAAKAKKMAPLKFSGQMSPQQIALTLEPTIHSALSTKAIRNEPVFRKTLLQEATKFRTICQALESIIPRPGWHVDGFQLQLTFNAQGQLTPVLGVGGALNIYFDWKKLSGSQPTPPIPADVLNSNLYRSLKGLIQAIATLVPEANAEAAELKNSGFALDQLQIGLALYADGTIGVAQSGAKFVGNIIFNADSTPSFLMASPDGEEVEPAVFLVAPASQVSVINYLGPQANSKLKQTKAFSIPIDKFKKGLIRALNMGTYFAKKAKGADTQNWKFTQLSTEFDLSLNGNMKLASAGMQGQIQFIFDRID